MTTDDPRDAFDFISWWFNVLDHGKAASILENSVVFILLSFWEMKEVPLRESGKSGIIREINQIKPQVYIRRITRSTKFEKVPFC